jgi:adenylate cyclase
VESHHGRVIDMAGDSVLAVFDTATGAVAAAQAVQRDLAEVGECAGDHRMRFRIGLHLGDIFEKGDGSVYGDGVNIAARLQSMATPGGIMASDAIKSAVRGRLPAHFVDRGEHRAKNIAHPLHAYALEAEGDAPVAPAAPPAPALRPPADRPSIAVLPFDNMSGDPQQEYFADGMVEEIITALARMGLFFVIARNSTFVYKGKAVDVRQIGRELGVRYVLEGSVRRSGDHVRIISQLIECENGGHVWADRFEGTLDDVFQLQDRVADSIVAAIEPNMRRVELRRVRDKPTESLQAYDLTLRGLSGVLPGASAEERDEALSFIRLALQKDPHYARAKAFGAFVCMRRIADGNGSAEDVKAGLHYADQVLSEGSDDPSNLAYAGAALGALGYRTLGVRVLGFRYEEAQRAIERALTLSPHLLMVQWCAGLVRGIVGDGDAAVEHFEHAIRLSPLDPAMSGFVGSVGAAHLISGRYEMALELSRRAVQDSPNFFFAVRNIVLALGHLGRMDEAKLMAKRLRELAPGFTVSLYQSTTPVKDRAYRKRAAEILLAAGIPK